jgi:type IV secretion system protein VirD4
VMPPSVLRTLPFGTAVLLLRHARPVVIDLQGWPDRTDADRLLAGRVAIEAATASSPVPSSLSRRK